jgi:hypothetical protein
MDFVMGLPRTLSGYDSLWEIVDRLAKVPLFIPIKMTYTGPQLVELYSSKIICFHGVPMWIVSNRGTEVILKFYERFNETLNSHLNFSFAYYSQTDGQTEQVN